MRSNLYSNSEMYRSEFSFTFVLELNLIKMCTVCRIDGTFSAPFSFQDKPNLFLGTIYSQSGG